MKRVFKAGLFGASALTLASCASLTGTETTADVVETAATDAVVEVVETVAEVETATAKVDAELIPREMIFGHPTYSSVQISGGASCAAATADGKVPRPVISARVIAGSGNAGRFRP